MKGRKISDDLKLVQELLYEWFPILQPLLEVSRAGGYVSGGDGYVYGGILREMVWAAHQYQEHGSLSRRQIIQEHVRRYLNEGGGDIDLFISLQGFHNVTGVYLKGNHSQFNRDRDKSGVFWDAAEYPEDSLADFSGAKTLKEITAVTTGYEIKKIARRMQRDEEGSREDARFYGYEDVDAPLQWTNLHESMDKLFPTRQFHMKVSSIFTPPATSASAAAASDDMGQDGQNGQDVTIDMIVNVKDADADVSSVTTDCDFECNLLKMTADGIDLKFSPGPPGPESSESLESLESTVESVVEQIRNRKIILLASQGRAQKLVYRLARRLQAGWTLDVSNEQSLTVLVDFLHRAVHDRLYDGIGPETATAHQRALDEKYDTFFRKEQPAEILTMFLACRKQLLKFMCERLVETPIASEQRRRAKFQQFYSADDEKWLKTRLKEDTNRFQAALKNFRKKPSHETFSEIASYEVVRLLEYFMFLCIRHNQFAQFLQWSKPIPYWSHKFAGVDHILAAAVIHCPAQLKTIFFPLCPPSSRNEAFSFVHQLMQHDRKEILTDFLTSSRIGKKVISEFNALDDEAKCDSAIFVNFFPPCFSSRARTHPKYLAILESHGFQFPAKLVGERQALWQPSEYSVDLLSFLWRKKMIDFTHLIPDGDVSYYVKPCIPATGEHLRWLLDEVAQTVPISLVHIAKIIECAGTLKKIRKMVDFDFLTRYKEFCLARQQTPDPMDWMFSEVWKLNDFEQVEKYFEYRFDTKRPTITQVSRLPLYLTHGTSNYYSAGYGPKRPKSSVARYISPAEFITCGDKIFKRLVLIYGPHLFLCMFKNPQSASNDTLLRKRNFMAWFYIVYWLWRISHNDAGPASIAAAWSIPPDVINIIVAHYIQSLNLDDKIWDPTFLKFFENAHNHSFHYL